jgi:predicted nucleic acid-binding protein
MLSKKVFLTPSSFLAFIDRAHPMHEQATAFFRYFAQESYQLYADYPDIMEVYRVIYNSISPSLARDYLRTMSITAMNIIYPEDADAKAALKALNTYQSTDLTYSNALMSVLAYKRNIQQICSFEYLHPLFGLQTFFLPI